MAFQVEINKQFSALSGFILIYATVKFQKVHDMFLFCQPPFVETIAVTVKETEWIKKNNNLCSSLIERESAQPRR